MSCPQCGGEVEKVRAEDGGAIEETVWTKGGLRRKVRPSTFYACGACEWCSEFPPPDALHHDGRSGVISLAVEEHEQPDGLRCPDCGGESCVCL